MSMTDDVVEDIEQFLEDCVTSTPIQLRFMASDLADYHGWDTWVASQALQRYRDVQGNLTLSTADYVVACYERGPRSTWFIFAWPHMTKPQRNAAADLLVVHQIMSLIREVITPMLRNIQTQFGPAVVGNRTLNRTMIGVIMGELEGYRTMLLAFQRDVTAIRPMTLRRTAVALNSAMTSTVSRIEAARAYVSVL